MKTLGIECSAKSASAAIFEDGRILAESFVNVQLTHSETLLSLTESMLKNAQLDKTDIDRFAVSVGPGSFTGVRIGVAAVKGMALALDKPCCGVSSLHAMACQCADVTGTLICPAMDARRGQVYTALFVSDGEKVIRLTEDHALPVAELMSQLPEILMGNKRTNDDIISINSILFLGDGAHLCYNEAKGLPSGLTAHVAGSHLRWQRASGVIMAAEGAPSCTPAELEPLYLRPPQAIREAETNKK